ncbi:hypothetical protein MAFF211491_20940 [Ralstonia solanacearum]|nr:hypothetical protein MAFF211491_20940 [Ralstonia solanacearum]BCM13084.1 hypothetical protein MAFF241648_22740 [Ralstonia solanacearum]
MEEKSALTKVQESLDAVLAELSVAKARVLELENQERRLTVTLEVLQSLNATTQEPPHAAVVHGGAAGTTHTGDGNSAVILRERPDLDRFSAWTTVMLRKSTRRLILEQFMAGEALTRIQVIGRIKATGELPNEGTVASTLSKLTADGVLERDGSAYRLKVAAPNADDTGSGHDLV